MASKKDFPFVEGCAVPELDQPRAKATLMMLARNSEIEDVTKSMKSLERHFNQWYQYPWTFLNDEPFTEEFKQTVKSLTNAKVQFGLIEKEIWEFPDDIINTTEFQEGIQKQGDLGIMYGAMESYHKMCRFFSGGFYKHELIKDLDWYWRVEPDVEFFCDLTYDPFIEMEKNGKKYGFNIILQELKETIPNLFRVTKSWMKKEKITPKSSWDLFVFDYTKGWKYSDEKEFNDNYKNIKDVYSIKSRMKELFKIDLLLKKLNKDDSTLLSDSALDENEIIEVIARAKDKGRLPTLQGEQIDNEVYNLFHFWSNFEIARVDVWNNEIYESYFKHLEKIKGFYKERWGDAPVHSIALGFLLDLNEIHYFRDIGYKHSTISHCPLNNPNSNEIEYKESENYKINDSKFNKKWLNFDKPNDLNNGANIGCRCKCPKNYEDIEDSGTDFYKDWVGLNSDHYNPKNEMTNIAKLENEVKKNLAKQQA